MSGEVIERRWCEVRTEGRRLSGVAIRYCEVARDVWGAELFEPGAFGDLSNADVILNIMHQRENPLARTGGGGLLLVDSPTELRIEADLPETQAAQDALTLLRSRILRGLSVEFRATEDRSENDIRRIARAKLIDVGLVDRPAYKGATVEARAAEATGRRRRRFFY